LSWSVALLGGVGGTFTVLCYGYWIREEGRYGTGDLRVCRIDLGVGYAMTALFGVAMVIVGSTIEISGGGATLLVDLGARLGERLGPIGSWMFLIGAAGAVFSSLLGVWQAVPYLFADIWSLVLHDQNSEGGLDARASIDTRSVTYRIYLVALAIIPMVGLFWQFAQVQKIYAIIGATFIPLLALVLLILNGRTAWVGAADRNKPLTTAVLAGILLFFSWVTYETVVG